MVQVNGVAAAPASAAAKTTVKPFSIFNAPLLAVEVRHRLEVDRLGVGRLQDKARGPRRSRERRLELGDQLALLVVAVDVVAEMNGTITRRPAGQIDPR